LTEPIRGAWQAEPLEGWYLPRRNRLLNGNSNDDKRFRQQFRCVWQPTSDICYQRRIWEIWKVFWHHPEFPGVTGQRLHSRV